MAGGGGSRNRKKTYSKPSDPRHHSPLGPPNHPTPTSTHTPTSRVRSLARAGFIISLLILSLTLFNMWLVSSHLSTNANNPLIYTAHVVNYYPHDPNAFTQGLLYGGNDTLYESTGLYGRSSIRKVDLKTGKVKYQRKMDHSVFGEGLTLLGDRLYQLTWMQKTGFIYDRSTFRPLAQFTHPMNDGWGLATDGKFLFGSDGSSTLYQINPQSWKGVSLNPDVYAISDCYQSRDKTTFMNSLFVTSLSCFAIFVCFVLSILRFTPISLDNVTKYKNNNQTTMSISAHLVHDAYVVPVVHLLRIRNESQFS